MFATLFFYLLRKHPQVTKKVFQPAKASTNRLRLLLVVMCIIVVAPRLIYAFTYYGTFDKADIYSNLVDSHLTMKSGHIEAPRESLYYAPFPIFLLLITLTGDVLALNSIDAYYSLYTIFLLLLPLCLIAILRRCVQRGDFALYYVAAFLSIMANTLVYGFFAEVIAQNLGMLVILLFTIVLCSEKRRQNVVLMTLFVILGISHPISLIIITTISGLAFLLGIKKSASVNEEPQSTPTPSVYMFILPAMAFFSYMAYTVALEAFAGGISLLTTFVDIVGEQLTTSGVTFVEGMSRQFPAISAMGLSLVVGLNVAYLFVCALRSRNTRDHVLLSLSLLSLGLTFVGFVDVIFARSKNIYMFRYAGVTGAFLGMVTASVMMNESLNLVRINLRERRLKRALGVGLICLLCLSVVGSLLDPYTFKPTEVSMYLQRSESFRVDVAASFVSQAMPRDIILVAPLQILLKSDMQIGLKKLDACVCKLIAVETTGNSELIMVTITERPCYQPEKQYPQVMISDLSVQLEYFKVYSSGDLVVYLLG